MSTDTFTCSKCKNIYNYLIDESWNEHAAKKEYEENFPECKFDPTDIICDNCYKELTAWVNSLSNEEKQKMREDYYSGINNV